MNIITRSYIIENFIADESIVSCNYIQNFLQFAT